MKWSGFNVCGRGCRLTVLLLGVCLFSGGAQEEKKGEALSAYEQRIQRYKRGWSKLIPDYSKLQYAGGMGMLSVGVGWDYGKNRQWETDVFMGFVPRFTGKHGHATFTVKENYYPWEIGLSPIRNTTAWTLEPLSLSLYVNKIFGNGEFWTKQPDKYPDKYYVLATNLRFNLAVGQRINLAVRHPHFAHTVSVFYEVGTNDLYLICAIQNKTLKLHDIFSLSLGLKFQFL